MYKESQTHVSTSTYTKYSWKHPRAQGKSPPQESLTSQG